MATMYPMKRSCLHNLYVTSSKTTSDNSDINEGLVLPASMLRLADIDPFEKVVVTKIGSDNWQNRIYTFVLPGTGDMVEARGSVAHFLKAGDLCCIISGTFFTADQFASYSNHELPIPIIDVRLYPKDSRKVNDLSDARLVLEQLGLEEKVDALSEEVTATRRALPRVLVSNLITGLRVEVVERLCIEMSAELPIEYMARAGFVKNQSIFVYNSSRGGMSAESYVVPSMDQKKVGISGALSRVADLNDSISEVAFVVSTERIDPKICSL
jgi:aspartate 1-decarboxylase